MAAVFYVLYLRCLICIGKHGGQVRAKSVYVCVLCFLELGEMPRPGCEHSKAPVKRLTAVALSTFQKQRITLSSNTQVPPGHFYTLRNRCPFQNGRVELLMHHSSGTCAPHVVPVVHVIQRLSGALEALPRASSLTTRVLPPAPQGRVCPPDLPAGGMFPIGGTPPGPLKKFDFKKFQGTLKGGNPPVLFISLTKIKKFENMARV